MSSARLWQGRSGRFWEKWVVCMSKSVPCNSKSILFSTYIRSTGPEVNLNPIGDQQWGPWALFHLVRRAQETDLHLRPVPTSHLRQSGLHGVQFNNVNQEDDVRVGATRLPLLSQLPNSKCHKRGSRVGQLGSQIPLSLHRLCNPRQAHWLYLHLALKVFLVLAHLAIPCMEHSAVQLCRNFSFFLSSCKVLVYLHHLRRVGFNILYSVSVSYCPKSLFCFTTFLACFFCEMAHYNVSSCIIAAPDAR